jgi:hypothetical protein
MSRIGGEWVTVRAGWAWQLQSHVARHPTCPHKPDFEVLGEFGAYPDKFWA